MGRSRIVRILVPTVLALAWLGAVGPAAPGAAGPAVPGRCADACPSVHDPVTCTFDNGDVQTFGNRCEAERYACRNGRTILSCSRGLR
ncbi:hypothetical protein ACQEU3_31710 [Spirillospora sp. CA-253888]